ncbi:MAG TPA: hypothetical protein VIM13_08645, partial [Clostridia bacterium]
KPFFTKMRSSCWACKSVSLQADPFFMSASPTRFDAEEHRTKSDYMRRRKHEKSRYCRRHGAGIDYYILS